MTLTVYNLDAGPQNAAVTSANSGCVSGFPVAVGGSVLYDSASALSGSFGITSTNAAGAVAETRFLAAAPSLTMAWAVGIKTFAAAAPENATHADLRWSGGVALYVRETTAGEIALYDSTGSSTKVVLLSGISHSHMYRVEVRAVVATATTGSYRANIYDGAGTTPLNGTEINVTGANLGTNPIVGGGVGRIGGVTAVNSVGNDYVAFNDGSTVEIGPPGATSAPTVTIGTADLYLDAGATASPSATVTGATTMMWTSPTIPAGAASPTFSDRTIAAPTVTGLVAGAYVLRLTATNSGGTTTGDVRIWVAAPANANVRVNSALTSTFSNIGGAASIAAALNDGNSATYAQSPTPAAGQPLTVVMDPIGPGAFTINVPSDYVNAAVNVAATLYKEDGTTVVDSWTWSAAATTSTQACVVDSAGLATLTGGSDAATRALRRALRFSVAGTAA